MWINRRTTGSFYWAASTAKCNLFEYYLDSNSSELSAATARGQELSDCKLSSWVCKYPSHVRCPHFPTPIFQGWWWKWPTLFNQCLQYLISPLGHSSSAWLRMESPLSGAFTFSDFGRAVCSRAANNSKVTFSPIQPGRWKIWNYGRE